MSMEATLDLLANYSPRSFCVFSAPLVASSSNNLGSGGNRGGTNSRSAVSNSTNPFEKAAASAATAAAAATGNNYGRAAAAEQQQNNYVMGVLYGTERGSLHYRCYVVNNSRSGGGSSSNQRSLKQQVLSSPGASSSTGGGGGVLAPLGAAVVSQASRGGSSSPSSSRSRTPPSSIPRVYLPVDLPSTSLSGAVVACIAVHIPTFTATAASTASQNAAAASFSLFLVLVDDHRGPSGNSGGGGDGGSISGSTNSGGGGGSPPLPVSSSVPPPHPNPHRHAGAYVARWVTLQHGGGGTGSAGAGFQVYSTTPAILGTAASNKHAAAAGSALPRMSAAVFQHGRLYYTAGRGVYTMSPPKMATTALEQQQHHHFLHQQHHADRGAGGGGLDKKSSSSLSSSFAAVPYLIFGHHVWPAAARSGPDAMAVVAGGRVVVACVGHAFYAAAGQEPDDDDVAQQQQAATASPAAVKLVTLTQSSQVHPVIVLDFQDLSVEADWSSLFVASGRECAVVDLYYGPSNSSQPRISCSKPRNNNGGGGGSVTTASPILAAASSWPVLALLTSDGLISIRSPSCLAIALRTVEVGTRPNDFFALKKTTTWWPHTAAPGIVSASYAGEAKVLQCQADTSQDLADRLMRHAIDAFGANGFPRTELAEAVQASFTATSYVGPEASQPQAKMLLKEYLEAVLGLCDWESGAASGWPTEFSSQSHQQEYSQHQHRGGGDSFHGRFVSTFAIDGGAGDHHHHQGQHGPSSEAVAIATAVLSASQPSALLTATALLCLVCSQLSPPLSSVASRAAKASASNLGVVVVTPPGSGGDSSGGGHERAASIVCEQVADKLLREASQAFSLLRSSSPSPIITRIHRPANLHTDFVEAAIWLFRSCGQHERALNVAAERLQQSPANSSSEGGADRARGLWSRIKYESYTATHLSELWASGSDDGRVLVLRSPVTRKLLESNPRMGLSVFTAMHPQNEAQWQAISFRDDPLLQFDVSHQVVELLKSIVPTVPYDNNASNTLPTYEDGILPLESGRSLAVTFLESAMGIMTGRPTEEDEFDHLAVDAEEEGHMCNLHDELSFLLLEGVISERSDDAKDQSDTDLGKIYRSKLRQLLRWPLAKIRPHHFLESLPPSFLQEKALVLGRLGNHEDALRILYRDLGSLELALEYCDERYERQLVQQDRRRARQNKTHMFSDHDNPEEVNAYLPLVRVALESEDTEKGCRTAIQVLALRRSAIDRAAALHLLPSDVPVSAVARPFLIPALVDSESQVRRLTVVSALLRARYLRLKDQLTSAQLRAQANLHVVPQLRSLNLGDPLHSTKPFRARTNSNTITGSSGSMPEVWIVKHYFRKYLVIQAKVTNQAGPLSEKAGRTLTDIAFVVAESSEEEAIQPIQVVTIPVLPPNRTGSCYQVLSAAPSRMEGATAQLTCELRFTVLGHGHMLAANLHAASQSAGVMGRNFVEELQDLEVHASHFS
jgi:Vam6/Vps39-like protein vacuolar protein sorting-associated protein 39